MINGCSTFDSSDDAFCRLDIYIRGALSSVRHAARIAEIKALKSVSCHSTVCTSICPSTGMADSQSLRNDIRIRYPVWCFGRRTALKRMRASISHWTMRFHEREPRPEPTVQVRTTRKSDIRRLTFSGYTANILRMVRVHGGDPGQNPGAMSDLVYSHTQPRC